MEGLGFEALHTYDYKQKLIPSECGSLPRWESACVTSIPPWMVVSTG